MPTVKDTLQSQDPLTMILQLAGKGLQGAGQGVYTDPNTGARNYSILQGAGGAAAGTADALLNMRQLKLAEKAQDVQNEAVKTQMELARKQDERANIAFQAQQDAVQEQRNLLARQELEQGISTGRYVKPTYQPKIKDPKTGKWIDDTTSKYGKIAQLASQHEGELLPTSNVQDVKQKQEMGKALLAGPMGLVMGGLGKTVTEQVPIPIVPGSNAGGKKPQYAFSAIQDDDTMTRIGHAIGVDPNLSREERTQLLSEWKQAKSMTAARHLELTQQTKSTLDKMMEQGMITPDQYNANMQAFGVIGARKNPEIAHLFNQGMASFLQGDMGGTVNAFSQGLANLAMRANPLADTLYRMGMQPTFGSVPSFNPTQINRQVTQTAKNVKTKFSKK